MLCVNSNFKQGFQATFSTYTPHYITMIAKGSILQSLSSTSRVAIVEGSDYRLSQLKLITSRILGYNRS